VTFELGIKSDPVEYRYSYEWLFSLLERLQVRNLQLGSSFEMYSLPDRYFIRLRKQAEDHGVRIISCFTAHRELGGLLSADPDLHEVARAGYRRWIEIGALVGAEAVGSNPGAIYRDQMETKPEAVERYLAAMTEMKQYAAQAGLEALTLETMSALAEPPTTPDEITFFMTQLNSRRETLPESAGGAVPVYVCGDISHGYANEDGTAVHSNLKLFEHAIPWMWEFHLKNTDARFGSTFGFGPEESKRGIVDLAAVADIIARNATRFPHDKLVGFLELPGPKLGRDYSDGLLEEQFVTSIGAIKRVFGQRG
jgi:sugar phosphate isomerase/epimerase